MGQVPSASNANNAFTSYLILGDGRLSRHFQHYLQFESLAFEIWSRAASQDALAEKISRGSHILFAVSDAAIEPLFRAHSKLLANKTCVHFSGALSTPLMPSAHPLMTFGDSLYDRETYLRLPFVTERDRGDLRSLLPGLTNPSFSIAPELKTRYHALCVMSGNFTVLLWEKVFAEFETRLGLPKQILLPYLLQTTENLALSKQSVLTGPLARGDEATINKHLNELADDAFADVYRSFLNAYRSGGAS